MHSDLLSQSLLWDNICASTLFPNSFSWGITTLCRFRIYFLIVTPVSLVSRWLRLLVPALEFTPWTVNPISFLENYVLRDIQHCDVGRRDGSWQKRRGKWVISGLEHTDRENNSTKSHKYLVAVLWPESRLPHFMNSDFASSVCP